MNPKSMFLCVSLASFTSVSAVPKGELLTRSKDGGTVESETGVAPDGEGRIRSVAALGMSEIYGKAYQWTVEGVNHGNHLTLEADGTGVFGRKGHFEEITWIQTENREVRFLLATGSPVIKFSRSFESFTGFDTDGESIVKGSVVTPGIESIFGKALPWTVEGVNHGNHLTLQADGTGVFGRKGHFKDITWIQTGKREIRFLLQMGSPTITFAKDFQGFKGLDVDGVTSVEGKWSISE